MLDIIKWHTVSIQDARAHRQVYDISATGVTMFCIRTDWCMILATGVTMFVYTQRQVYDISATGFTIFCIRTD